MPDQLLEIGGERVLLLGDDHSLIGDADGPRELVEAALSERATLVAVPVSRLGGEFFQLRTGLAGELLQKAANYRIKLAVIGDVSAHTAASNAFRDLVIESEHGESLYFAEDVQALEKLLAPAR